MFGNIRPIFRSSIRFIRKRPDKSGILEEGATFSDVHNVILAPNTKLPYPDKQLQEHIEKTSGDLMKERNRIRYGGKKKASSEIDFSHIPIEEHVVVLFPGQGAQFVGMGKKVIEIPNSKRVFEEASEILGYDLLKICLDGPSNMLENTLYCQPAVVAASLAAYEALKSEDSSIEENLTDTAGFSVGEYAALVAGGILRFEDAIRIVKTRAEAMAECARLVRSGMITVRLKASTKLDRALSDARKAAAEKGEMDVCDVANYLYCGMRVIGGTETSLKYLEDNQKKYDLQVLKRLPVSAAFHTRQMESAVAKVMEAVCKAQLEKATCNVYSNYTGHVLPAKKAEIRGAISKQVNSPVKWEQIQQLVFRKHQDDKFPRIYEVGPGRQLGAMIMQTSKKMYRNYSNYSC